MKQWERDAADRWALGEWTCERLIADELDCALTNEEWAVKRERAGAPALAAVERRSAADARERADLLAHGAQSDYERGRAAFWAAWSRHVVAIYEQDARTIAGANAGELGTLPSAGRYLHWADGARLAASLFDAMACGAAPLREPADRPVAGVA